MPEMDFKHLSVEFFMDTEENKNETAKQGRPIFTDIEMVRIRMAGDPKSIHVAPAKDFSSVMDGNTGNRLTYAELHHGPYDAFKKNAEYIGEGTPLSEVPFITESKRKELAHFSVFTVEALAGLEGANLTRLGMGARKFKELATEWLSKATGAAGITRMQAENDDLKARLLALEEKLGGGSGEAQKPVVDSSATEPSPFADWDDDTIKLWIVEQGGAEPHHRTGHDKLVIMAGELNAELKRQKEAA